MISTLQQAPRPQPSLQQIEAQDYDYFNGVYQGGPVDESPIQSPSANYQIPEAPHAYLHNIYHDHHRSDHHQKRTSHQQQQQQKRHFLRSLPSQSKLKLQKPFNQAMINTNFFDIKIISLCAVLYMTSIISNNSTKAILKEFKYPITLTELQFILSQVCCLVAVLLLKLFDKDDNFKKSYFPNGTFPLNQSQASGLKKFMTPTKFILATTIPMGAFQFIGHITSHKATSVIPVSLVHTIKALSPITTVLIYRLVYKRNFNKKTYLTLIPLVIGVMLCCFKKPATAGAVASQAAGAAASSTGYEKGCFFAFCSMIIFVSQNIFAKKILTASTTTRQQPLIPQSEQPLKLQSSSSAAQQEDLATSSSNSMDKLTILYWCSAVGFILTLPIYFCTEFSSFPLSQITPQLWSLIGINGLAHFLQSLMAFQILGVISTVNYSIVNILKRICVIVAAIAYERQNITSIQGVGLVLTFVGLYSYEKWGK